MYEPCESLKNLAEIQAKLLTFQELLESQNNKQTQLTSEMLNFSSDVICELRLLSLVRSQIMKNDHVNVNRLVKSQMLKGLTFSNLVYCPAFFDSNLLNHYMTFISFMRSDPAVLAKSLYHYSKLHPELTFHLAYSVFLTLFQQGWCVEEDHLLYLTLKEFADYQFQLQETIEINNNPPKTENFTLRPPLTSPAMVLQALEPFASFVTSYLFNCCSLSYLQSALSQTITIVHSLSSLRESHNNFTTSPNSDKLAPYAYWTTICQHAKYTFNSLINSFELLPSGVALLFNHIRNHPQGGDKACILLFFESFVNRALENPAVLGLLPWHPDSNDWSPLKDIAVVFRAKYLDLLPSTFLKPILGILESIPEFQALNFNSFIDALTDTKCPNTSMISEKELIYTNPLFPKELVITGRDICSLHKAALSLPEEFKSASYKQAMARLGEIPEENEAALEHFRIVLQRQREITAAAKLIRQQSLFSINEDKNSLKRSDPFAEAFCDSIATLPSFINFIDYLHPSDAVSFLDQMRILTPHFLEEKDWVEADSVLYYAVHSSGPIESFLPRIDAVTEMRNTRAMEAADRSSSINTQHQRISDALKMVLNMRENVQSYLVFNIATSLVHENLQQSFQMAMFPSHAFLTNIDTFNNSTALLLRETNAVATNIGINPNHTALIARVLFFKMTDHVTFISFIKGEKAIWKNSTIINQILKQHQKEMIEKVTNSWREAFELRRVYIERAADLLGHIRGTSGISVMLYYVVEMIVTVTELTKNCKELSFDQCILLVMIMTKMNHIYGANKFIAHFLLGNNSVDTLLTAAENQYLSVFSSAVCMLNRLCSEYDKRITSEWD